MEALKQRFGKVREECIGWQKDVDDFTKVVKARMQLREVADDKIRLAEATFDAAAAQLKGLDQKAYRDLKMYYHKRAPNAQVRLVLEAVRTTLGEPNPEDWAATILFVSRRDFPGVVQYYRAARVSQVALEILATRYLPDPRLASVDASTARVGLLWQWLQALVAYRTMLKEVDPSSTVVSELEGHLDQGGRNLVTAQERVLECKDQLRRLQHLYTRAQRPPSPPPRSASPRSSTSCSPDAVNRSEAVLVAA